MMDKVWVGMLRSESKKPRPAADAHSYKKAVVKAKGGTKKKQLQSTYTGSQTEVKEKLLTGIAQTVEEEGAGAAASEREGIKAKQDIEDLKKINGEQQRLISKLTSENARLVNQVDLLWQSSPVKVKDGMNGSFEVQVLRNALEQCTREKQMLMNELHRERQKAGATLHLNGHPDRPEGATDQSHLIAVLKESLDEKTQQLAVLTVQLEDARAEVTASYSRRPGRDDSSGPLDKDVQQLSVQNTSLSRDLDNAKQTRALLEKELLGLKRELAEVNSECAQLKEYSLQLQEEREVLVRQVEAKETQAQLSIDELGVHMEEAVMQKTTKIQELLDYAEELQDTLSTLVKEKDLLTTSLRQEAEYTRQLEEEKETMERQLSDSNGKLQSLEQELQRISEMQDELEAGQRAGDEIRVSLEADLVSATREREELASTVGALQEGLRTACSEVEGKAQQNRILSVAVTQLEKEKGVLEEQLANMKAEVAQMESRFAVLRHEMGEVKESVEQRTRREVDAVSLQLSTSTQHAQQLLSEKAVLEGRVRQLERQLAESRQGNEELADAREELEAVASRLSLATTELEDFRQTNGLLNAQVSDLEGQLVNLRTQLEESNEHAEDVAQTLSQQSAYTSQLESIIEQQKAEIQRLSCTVSQSMSQVESSTPHHRSCTDNLKRNTAHSIGVGSTAGGGGDVAGAEDSSLEISSIDTGPPLGEGVAIPTGGDHQGLSSFVCTSRARQRHSVSPDSEVLSLRQRLGESQQQSIKLEAQLASLKTEVAKLQGSVQALTTIKSHLTEQNQGLQEVNRELEGERDGMQREREMVVMEMSRARDTIETLSTELSSVSQSKEELLVEYRKVQTKLAELQEELSTREEEVCALDDQRAAAERELENATEEVHTMRRKVESHRESLGLCQMEKAGLEQCIRQEASLLTERVCEVDRSMSALKEDSLAVQEELRVAETINVATSARLEENEGNVSALLGEVEALRAKRSVMLQYVVSQDEQHGEHLQLLVTRLEEENRALQQKLMGCSDDDGERRRVEAELAVVQRSKEDEVSRLLGLLDEAEREKAMLQEELGSKVPCLKKGDELSRMQRKLDRMHTKMDVQSRQINYLRIKLGYTLAELRLYKRLKEEMGSQVEQLQAQILLSQEQYRQCLLRLQQAGIGLDPS